MNQPVDKEKKARTGVNLRVTEAEKLYFDVWYQGVHDRTYTGLPNTAKHQDRCEKVRDLMLREIELGVFDLSTFDITRYLPDVRQRRKRVQTTATQDMTFLEFGKGPWYERKRAKSETKAKEYLGDLRLIAATKIGDEIKAMGDTTADKDKRCTFGSIKLGEMKPEYIDQLTNALKKRPGRKKARLGGTRLKTLLEKVTRSVLELAYAREYMSRNPRPWFESQREEDPDVDPLSFGEILAFLAALPDPKFVRLYTVFFGTGLRPSELYGLEWRHVDFHRKQIHVRQGFVNGRLTELKTKGSRREIDMLPHVEEALHAQQQEGTALYVFVNSEGGPLHRDNMRNRIWNPAMARAGLRPRNPYQTRHTFASLMLEQNESPGWVAKMLGHTSMRMLYQRYGKYIRNRTQQDGTKFGKALQQAVEERERANHP